MSASQATVSRQKKVLEKDIEEEQTDWAKSNLLDDISNLQCRIDELKPLQEHKRKLDELEQQLRDISEHGWGKYPGSLDDKIVVEYLNKFTTLPLPLTPKIPFINIIMIGVTGSGKSSFLRTFATALTNSDYIKDIYRACPIKNREKSATKKIHYEPIYMGDKGPKVPCRFFDMPGIDEEEAIKKNKLEKLLIGEITCTLNDEINRETDMEIQTPNPANVVHCILYVIRASTNLKDLSTSVKSMIEVLKDHNSEDGVRQFVVVTSIDEIGVPNSDMINAYKYPCVRKFCEEVSVVFGVDLLHVIPVSNYFDEVAPNDAKNAMSLFNLWRVFNSTKEYIERRWLKGETIMISKEWSCKKNNV
uniref:Septin-type G domain-containing protein n=1 Tax=Magallana gigas TaxID=29159 RepID=A0A8W8P034_MAGGI